MRDSRFFSENRSIHGVNLATSSREYLHGETPLGALGSIRGTSHGLESTSMSSDPAPYQEPSAKPDYPAIERDILARWERDHTFEASLQLRSADDEYVFYDGPPFANGLPHYGHLLTGYVKDLIPRYQTMRGHRVERRFGWDCHGLPAEMATEKEIGVSGRVHITDYGIDKFNDACRSSVLRYTEEWRSYVTRQARWVDFDNDYKTLDVTYMESVIWAFKELWDKGLLYETYRVMPYSWGAQTPLSNFEIRLDDATRPRQDPAITVAFEVLDAGGHAVDEIWAWTTTPWTLPSNLALAVGPNLDYAVVTSASRHNKVLVAASAVERYRAQLGEDAEVVEHLKGSAIAGWTYRPLFEYFAGRDRCFRVLTDDYVTDDDGTGVVHMAPGFGEDDQRVCEANGIVLVCPVDDAGCFSPEVTDWNGVNVFDANPLIINELKSRHQVIRHDTYDHNYPHCWRTDTPIIYKAVSSWYVKVTELTDRLLAHNQAINWIPEHVRDGQFGKWLEGGRDWSISRNRFWGAPIPVWQSDDPAYPRIDVYGSIAELEADFGVPVTDLHRPSIDNLTRPNPDDPTGRSTMRRVPEVLDCWFESGSMPFAQVHYPFEAKDWFDEHSPADFIVEYIAQTRGWFYTMHVLSVALFDRPAFANVMCHGVVLDSDGKKLSKKLRNYPDPQEVMETIGSDALRWYLMSSPILRGGDLRIAQDGAGIADVVRHVVNPIWNALSFFVRYANVDGYTATLRHDATGMLDRYILAKTATMVEQCTQLLDAYDVAGACHEVVSYLDALNNWFIRRSRERFWAAGHASTESFSQDKRDAYDTLYTALDSLLRVCGPLLPLLSEEMFSILHPGESVHLQPWPQVTVNDDDRALVATMDITRAVCSSALRLREDAGLRTRLPLRTLTIAGPTADQLHSVTSLIGDEVNVKAVLCSDSAAGFGTEMLKPFPKVLGPILGSDVQSVLAAAKAGDWTRTADGVHVGGHHLSADQFEIVTVATPGTASHSVKLIDPEGNSVDLGLVVSLDLGVDESLLAEGTARDVVRAIQNLRKERDLVVTDRIAVTLYEAGAIGEAVEAHRDFVASSVLATALQISTIPAPLDAHRVAIEDGALVIGMELATPNAP